MPIVNHRNQNDSAWKDILEAFFPQAVEFFFPWLFAAIDWSVPFVMMDKELEQITPASLTGKSFVDKLVKVALLTGEAKVILVHIEIQGVKDPNFPLRMFTYYYKLFDRYRLTILPLALLTDNTAYWLPQEYVTEVCGQVILSFKFESVKLLDYIDRKMELTSTPNMFGIVVLAQLFALKTQRNSVRRFERKLYLTKYLLRSGRSREEVMKLLAFIDWVMVLPKPMEIEYTQEINSYAEEHKVSYVTSFERFAIEKGMKQGLEQGLEKGIKKGIEKGMEKGTLQATRKILLNMLDAGISEKDAAKIIKIDIIKLRDLLKTEEVNDL